MVAVREPPSPVTAGWAVVPLADGDAALTSVTVVVEACATVRRRALESSWRSPRWPLDRDGRVELYRPPTLIGLPESVPPAATSAPTMSRPPASACRLTRWPLRAGWRCRRPRS